MTAGHTAPLQYTHHPSPIGSLLLAGHDDALEFIGFASGKGVVTPAADWQTNPDLPLFQACTQQLDAYFAGTLRQFDLPLRPQGTDFQCQVLAALQTIPYGKTVSYADLARQIGHPKAVRAVGAANGRNPLPIVIPCHRVIGQDGSLTGFGGGLPVKRFLLELESGLNTLPLI
ncbi:MAG: methylated-DNA--[protein]-cysteine S-methyltransferase [Thiothrix sp.]|nr:methylated-DNA--[protein]-cysteine S-methyltransferase [Thiothrix sp.]HPQ96005.1 methylated-DNA--[protein]-cysteine S-methyltransferase [Thiolinea sp.]